MTRLYHKIDEAQDARFFVRSKQIDELYILFNQWLFRRKSVCQA